jgi:hypothetical protein
MNVKWTFSGNWHVLWCRISTTFGAIFGILSVGGIFIAADLVEFYKGTVQTYS